MCGLMEPSNVTHENIFHENGDRLEMYRKEIVGGGGFITDRAEENNSSPTKLLLTLSRLKKEEWTPPAQIWQ